MEAHRHIFTQYINVNVPLFEIIFHCSSYGFNHLTVLNFNNRPLK